MTSSSLLFNATSISFIIFNKTTLTSASKTHILHCRSLFIGHLKSLKSICDDWGISILLLSQAVGTKEGSKEPPRKAAGTMELSRKAELIIGVHKDEIYPDTLQFAILKNRYGPVDDSYRTRLCVNWSNGEFFAPNESPMFNSSLQQESDDNDDITDF